MAISGTVTISASVTGAPAPTESLSVTETNASAVGEVILQNLTTTPTAVAIPSGARFAIITPPSGNTVNIAVGGTGVALANMLNLDPVNSSVLPLPSSSPVLLMACASSTVSGVQIMFI